MSITFADAERVRAHCLCLGAQRAARALARRFDARLRPLGVRSGQFSLLMALNRPEPPAMGPVAELLGLDRTTLTAALKPLERRGLVAVEPRGRARRLRLTEEGRALLAAALPLWRAEHAALDAALDATVGADALRRGLAQAAATSSTQVTPKRSRSIP